MADTVELTEDLEHVLWDEPDEDVPFDVVVAGPGVDEMFGPFDPSWGHPVATIVRGMVYEMAGTYGTVRVTVEGKPGVGVSAAYGVMTGHPRVQLVQLRVAGGFADHEAFVGEFEDTDDFLSEMYHETWDGTLVEAAGDCDVLIVVAPEGMRPLPEEEAVNKSASVLHVDPYHVFESRMASRLADLVCVADSDEDDRDLTE